MPEPTTTTSVDSNQVGSRPGRRSGK
jgi:hypothetical protein